MMSTLETQLLGAPLGDREAEQAGADDDEVGKLVD